MLTTNVGHAPKHAPRSSVINKESEELFSVDASADLIRVLQQMKIISESETQKSNLIFCMLVLNTLYFSKHYLFGNLYPRSLAMFSNRC